MSTTYLGLFNTGSDGNPLSAAHYNSQAQAIDRLALSHWNFRQQGVKSGWTLPETVGKSVIQSGQGQVGPVYLRTTASQVISNLTSGTVYIHALATPSAAWDGSVKFAARTTSAAQTNADGITTGTLLGTVLWNSTTGVTDGSWSSMLREETWNYTWKKLTVEVSVAAVESLTTASAAQSFVSAVKLAMPGTITAQTSAQLKVYNMHSAGFTVECYNKQATGSFTYSQTYTFWGLVGD